jgi:hypothetical protein
MTDPTVADPDLLAGRLFFAVPVPGAAREPLEAALPRLEPLLGAARVAPPGGWHLTLAFLGQVRPELADEVVRVGEAAVAGVPAARLRLECAGTFPEGRRPGCCGPASAATPRSWSAWPRPWPPPARPPASAPRTGRSIPT